MAENFIDYLRHEKRYATNTLTAYQNDLDQFRSFIAELGINDPASATSSIIRLWVVHLVESGANPVTLRRKLSALNTYYKYAIRKGFCRSNPAKGISLPKVPVRLPKFVEQSKLLNHLSNNDAFDSSFPGIRDKLIIEMLYATGMRRNELLQLKWLDISYSSGQLRIFGKGGKERIIPISKHLISQLEEYKKLAIIHLKTNELPERIILTDQGKPAYPELIYKTVKKHLSLCSTQEKKSPHVLRHSFATHLSNNGAPLNDIKELLGHASLASTQVYTHNTIEQLKEVYKIAHPKA
jgi:integrase/recombinase XerC